MDNHGAFVPIGIPSFFQLTIMHKVSLALAVLGSAASVFAQNCNGAPAAQVFSNRAEFGASFYYNIGAHIF